MKTQRIQSYGVFGAGFAVGLLLSIASAAPALAADAITDPARADQVLLERAKVAKQIVVEGQPGALQAEQEKAALDRAQQGWQSMDASRAAAIDRKASWEAAKQEAARLKEQREAKYFESTMNMERLLARQQEIAETRRQNEQAAQQRDLKDWTVVGDATDAGFAEQQRREQVRQENLKRYQASLQSGYAALKPQDGKTVQQQLEAEQKAREQQLLQYNTGYWNQVMKQSDDGRQLQESVIQANRENQIRHMQERVKEWGTIDQGKDEGLREQALREQVRQANAERYQQQLAQDYKTSRAGSQVVTTPGAVPGAATAPADAAATPAAAAADTMR